MPISGDTLRKDPSAKLVYDFDFGPDLRPWLTPPAQISSYTVTITGSDGVAPALLTKDNDAIADSGTRVRMRLLGGTLNVTYTVVVHIVTNETPAQEDERTVYIKIANQ